MTDGLCDGWAQAVPDGKDVGYLAQHGLFDQLPRLAVPCSVVREGSGRVVG